MTATPRALSDYPLRAFDKLRHADTDRQGHINNTVFASMLETGRVELLYHPQQPLFESGCAFVIASQQLDFLGEITWPGQVEIGTGAVTVGKSSLTLEQGLFQNGHCVATARTVIVQMNEKSRHSQPLGETAQRCLAEVTFS